MIGAGMSRRKKLTTLFAVAAIVIGGAHATAGGRSDLLEKLRVKITGKPTTTRAPTVATTEPATTTTADAGAVTGGSTSAGSVVSTVPLVGDLLAIASNFDVQTQLRLAWGSGGIPPVINDDPVGAFRFVCHAGQLLYDDPIVYPGQPGKSHLHQFFGNLAANAHSTYASLRTTGGSTCEGSGTTAINRSAYWIPAMLDGAGSVVRPDYVALYYKSLPKTDARCGTLYTCTGIPTGLRFVTGYNMSTRADDTWATPISFYCDGGNPHRTLAAAVADCPVGATRVTASIPGPDCWDGKNLDSADHRSHVKFSSPSDNTCPAGFPYLIPRVTIGASFTIDANFHAGKWHLSSDEMMPGAAAGTTFHADYMEGWDPTIRNVWQSECVDAHRSASGGDLCNGQQIVNAYISSDAQLHASPRLVPLPPMPSMTM